MNKLPSIFSLILLLNVAFSSSSAQAQERKGWSPQAKGVGIGVGSGAILGAVINKRNRAVGGVVGGGVGYGVGKHIDNKNKERARIAAANRAAARAAEYREASRRSAAHSPRETATTRPQTANSLVAPSGVAAPVPAGAALTAANAGYLPNDSYGDASQPYSNSEYRRKSW